LCTPIAVRLKEGSTPDRVSDTSPIAAPFSPEVERRVSAVACEIAARLWGGSWRALEDGRRSVDRLDDFRTTGRVSEEKAA
jgi:hypothetical protein